MPGDIPGARTAAHDGKGGFHLVGEGTVKRKRERRNEKERSIVARAGKKEGGKKENESCLVHPLWGPDRYESARG